MDRKRNVGLDLCKIFACIGVVAIHTMQRGLFKTGSWDMIAYMYYLATYSIPLFFMVNGYFMLHKKEIAYIYIYKKIKQIILLVVAWTCIIWFLKRNFYENLILKVLGSFVEQGYFYQFWFLGALIFIYLTLPILKRYLNTRKRYTKLLILLGIIGLGFEIANTVYKDAFQAVVPIQTFRLWTWYFYYILGGWIAQINPEKICYLKCKVWKLLVFVLFFISPIYLFFVAKNIHHRLNVEFSYDNLLVKIIAVGIFLMCLQLKTSNRKEQAITFLSSLTMGVFILHSYVMAVWESKVGLDFQGAFPLYFLAVVFLSFVGSAFIFKIPYLNRIIKT